MTESQNYYQFSFDKLNELAYQNDPLAQEIILLKAYNQEINISDEQQEHWIASLEANKDDTWSAQGLFFGGMHLLSRDFVAAMWKLSQSAQKKHCTAALFFLKYLAKFQYDARYGQNSPKDKEFFRNAAEVHNLNEHQIRQESAETYLKAGLKYAEQLVELDNQGALDNCFKEDIIFLYSFLGWYYYSHDIISPNGFFLATLPLRDENYEEMYARDIIKAEKYLMKAISLGNAPLAEALLGAIYTGINEYEDKYVKDVSAKNFSAYKEKGAEHLIRATQGKPENFAVACAYARVIKMYIDGTYTEDIEEIIQRFFGRKDFAEFDEQSTPNTMVKWEFRYELSYQDLQNLKSRVSPDIQTRIDAYIHRSEVWVCPNCGEEYDIGTPGCDECNYLLKGRFDRLKGAPELPEDEETECDMESSVDETNKKPFEDRKNKKRGILAKLFRL